MDDKSAPTNLPQVPTNQKTSIPTPSGLPAPQPSHPSPVPPQTFSVGSKQASPSLIDSLSMPKIQPTPGLPQRPPSPPPATLNQPSVRPIAPVTPPPIDKPPLPSSSPAVPVAVPKDVSLKSSIRTMQDDLANIKKGQMPVGVEFQKSRSEITKPTQPPVFRPSIPPLPLKPLVQVELGKTRQAKPLNQPGISIPPLPSSTKPPVIPLKPATTVSGVAIPPTVNRIGHRNIYLIIIGVVILLSVIGYFTYSNYFSATPVPSATPTSTTAPTPTPILSMLEKVFGIPGSINIITGIDPYIAIQTSTNQANDPGEINFFNITTNSGSTLSFSGFLARLGVSHPPELDILNESDGFILGVSNLNTLNNKKSWALVVSATNLTGIDSAMKTWEITAPNDIKTLFELDPTQKASSVFLDNSYQGIAIRYMNFPNTDSTIDYAIIGLPSGLNFLVITSSKDLIYSLVDIIISSQSR